MSFIICVTNSSCTAFKLCVVSYVAVAVNCLSKSSLCFFVLVNLTFTVIDNSVCAECPSLEIDLLRWLYCVISPSKRKSPFLFT